MSKEIRDGKTVWWYYQGRRVNTQDGGAGGALHINLAVPAGAVFRLTKAVFAGPLSAGSTLTSYGMDEDGATTASYISIAAGASRVANLPQPGGGATTHNAQASSENLVLGPGESIKIAASTAAVTETLTVYIAGLISIPSELTWTTTGSGGTPNLAASTISTANTLQAVVM